MGTKGSGELEGDCRVGRGGLAREVDEVDQAGAADVIAAVSSATSSSSAAATSSFAIH